MLLRAAEPIEGAGRDARAPRARESRRDLCSGPAKLCQAFGVDRTLDGADLVRGRRSVDRGGDAGAGRARSSPGLGWASASGASARGGSAVADDPFVSSRTPASRPLRARRRTSSFDTVIITELVWNAETPADGLWEMTVPAGCVEIARTTFT